MARIYQNERLLMKEVGLISKWKLTITTSEDIIVEGTERDVKQGAFDIINNFPDVISVDGEKI